MSRGGNECVRIASHGDNRRALTPPQYSAAVLRTKLPWTSRDAGGSDIGASRDAGGSDIGASRNTGGTYIGACRVSGGSDIGRRPPINSLIFTFLENSVNICRRPP